MVIDPRTDAYATIEIVRVRQVKETALDVAEVFADAGFAEIFNASFQCNAIVPWDMSRLLEEHLDATAYLGVDRGLANAYPVFPGAVAYVRRSVRSALASGNPDYQYVPVAVGLGRENGLEGRSHASTTPPQPPLSAFDIRGR